MATKAAKALDPEGAVRLYLMYVQDPGSLRDPSAVSQAEAAVAAAKDPIDRLRALADLEKAGSVDEAALRAGFVEHATAWAETNGVPASAFRELKVTDDVLLEAGFELPHRRRGRPARSTGRRSTAPRARAKSVPVEDIKAYAQTLSEPFTLVDVQSGAGGSPATVRKAVEELVAARELEKLGPDPEHSGRGRAPIRYAAK